MTPIEALKANAAELADEFGKGEARDDGKVAVLLEKQARLLADPAAAGYGATDELKTQITQLRADLDAEVKARRQFEKLGLGLAKAGGVIVPGRSARREMLADGRAFYDDDMAAEFGALMAVHLAGCKGAPLTPDQLPRYTKDLAKTAQQKATPDIEAATGIGAELVANLYLRELIRNVETYGTVFPECRRVALATMGTVTVPKRTAGMNAYWTAAGATINQSGIAFDTVTLHAEKLAALTAVTREMFLDPALLADLGQLIGLEIALAIAYALDNAVVNGDGTATYGGITGLLKSATLGSAAAATGHTTIALMDAGDVSSFSRSLTIGMFYNQAKWYGHLSVREAFLDLRTTTGGWVFRDRADDAGRRILKGYPWVVGQLFPPESAVATGDKFACFGDLRSAYLFGSIRGVEIASSEHVWFDQGLVAVRGIIHADAAEADANAINTLAAA